MAAARRLARELPTEYNRFILGLAANKARRFREAAETLVPLDPDRGQLRDWPYYWHNVTWALHYTGDHHRELEFAREAWDRYPQRLQALHDEVAALAALGRWEEALSSFGGGSEVSGWPSAGPARPGYWYVLAARELRAHGNPAAATHLLEEALQWHAQRPDLLGGQRQYRYHRSEVLYELGLYEEARGLLVDLVKERPDLPNYRGHLGTTLARQGDYSAAESALTWLRSAESSTEQGVAQFWQARILSVLGREEEAVAKLGEALRDGGILLPVIAYGYDLHTGIDYDPLRGLASFQRLIRPRG